MKEWPDKEENKNSESVSEAAAILNKKDAGAEIGKKIRNAQNFESLAEIVESIGTLDVPVRYGGPIRHYGTEELLGLLQILSRDPYAEEIEPDQNQRDRALQDIPETYGLRAEVKKLVAQQGKGVRYVEGTGLIIDPEVKRPDMERFFREERERTEKEPKFLTQWEYPDHLRFEGTEVFVYDIRPEHEKTDVPIAFVPGFGGTPLIFKKDIDTLVDNGRRVVSVDALHGVPHQIPDEKKRDLPDAELRKVKALMETLNIKGIGKVDGVGNSEGSMVLVMAAALYPERFRNLVLEQPAGLIGEDAPLRLGVRFGTDIIKSEIEAIRKKVPRKPHGITPPIKSSNLSLENLHHALQEVRAIARTKLPELLKELRSRGIGVSIIHGIDDNAFPIERVQKMVDLNVIDGFYSVRGKHAEVRSEEEKDDYAKLVERALKAMEEKRGV